MPDEQAISQEDTADLDSWVIQTPVRVGKVSWHTSEVPVLRQPLSRVLAFWSAGQSEREMPKVRLSRTPQALGIVPEEQNKLLHG